LNFGAIGNTLVNAPAIVGCGYNKSHSNQVSETGVQVVSSHLILPFVVTFQYSHSSQECVAIHRILLSDVLQSFTVGVQVNNQLAHTAQVYDISCQLVIATSHLTLSWNSCQRSNTTQSGCINEAVLSVSFQ
jgi:hypothetical protein